MRPYPKVLKFAVVVMVDKQKSSGVTHTLHGFILQHKANNGSITKGRASP